MNLLPAMVVEAPDGRRLRVGTAEIALPADRAPALPAGTQATFGIRPEDLHDRPIPGSGGFAVDVEIVQVERLGAETIAVARIAGVERPLFARIAGDAAFDIGERRPLYLDLDATFLFDQAGTALRPG